LKPILWQGGVLKVLDQRLLPARMVWLKVTGAEDAHRYIKSMVVRGAPLIGVVGAFGLAIEARRIEESDRSAFIRSLSEASDFISSARPTAVNLPWAVGRVLKAARGCTTVSAMKEATLAEAVSIMQAEEEMSRRIGRYGAELLRDGDTVLTHCNAGSLATVDYGTALAPVRVAMAEGKKVNVIATETRPALQGARLTTFELMHDNIDVTLICDTMVGHVMSKGMVDKVFVGADRVLVDGTVINKVGTYQVAVLAKRHGVPFYSLFPSSTFDLFTPLSEVKIEERDPAEVTTIRGRRIAPNGVHVLNPAFDVTPPELVAGYVTDRGLESPPFKAPVAYRRS